MDALDILLTTTLWAAAVRIAAPYVFGTLGELICERAGVLNLGIEGIMTAGAFAGWYTVYAGGDLWTGVLVAALVGAAFGLLHGVLVVPLGLSQHVVGIGITLFASSLTYYSYRVLFPKVTSPPRIAPFEPFAIPYLSKIPFLGEVLFHQTPLTYLSFILVGIAAYVLYRTPVGLAVRTVGENPAAVEAQGIDVTLLRIGAVMVGSAIMAIGGAFLTMSAFNAFFFEMVNGRGWICIALVVFGSLAAGQGAAGRAAVRAVRRLSAPPAAACGAICALSAIPDAALRAVDPGADRDVAPRRLPTGADGALPEGER